MKRIQSAVAQSRIRARRVLCAIAILVLAYLASANAWWHYRGEDFLAPNTFFSFAFGQLDGLGRRTTFLWFPGWMVVELLWGEGSATRTTDIAIPIFSGLIWGGLSIVTVKVIWRVQSLRQSRK